MFAGVTAALHHASLAAGHREHGAAEHQPRPFASDEAAATALRMLCGRHRPDGIVTGSDAIASSVLEAARTLGIDVPRRGCPDRLRRSTVRCPHHPTLTTVRMPLSDIGRAAARMLFDLSDGRPTQCSIVVRNSTPAGF